MPEEPHSSGISYAVFLNFEFTGTWFLRRRCSFFFLYLWGRGAWGVGFREPHTENSIEEHGLQDLGKDDEHDEKWVVWLVGGSGDELSVLI